MTSDPNSDNAPRALLPATRRELSELLQGVVIGSRCEELGRDVILEYWGGQLPQSAEDKNAFFDPDTQEMVVTLWDRDKSIGGVRVKFQNGATQEDQMFVRAIARIFDHDVRVCHTIKETDELWHSLRHSQISRAIGRALAPYDGEDAASWIRVMESSVALTYENRPVRQVVVVPYKFPQLEKRVGKSLIHFSESMSFKDAVLAEKWVRAVVDGKRVALVATKKHRGQVRGFLSMQSVGNRDVEDYVPHESLLQLFSVLERRDVAFVVSEVGDLWVLSGRGVFWQKTQGRWKYLNYSHIHKSVSTILKSEDLARTVLKMCIDLAYERNGALFWLPENVTEVGELIIDFDTPRTNVALRQALRGARIENWNQRQVIAAAAGTDGATIIDRSGKLVDIAVMLGSPNVTVCKKCGFNERQTFPGARTTAAWNASLYGISIKVSEDGPISVWHHGKEVARLG